jgi:hypothetical protein
MKLRMRRGAMVGLALACLAGCGDSGEEQADAAPARPDPAWLERFDGTTTLTFEVPAGNPIPDQVVSTAWVGTEAIADDYQVSLDRDDDFDRWFVPLAVNETAGQVVAGYSFGSFIADDPDGNTTVIMMTATGGTASVDGGLALTVEGTIEAQQGLDVVDGTFVATFE